MKTFVNFYLTISISAIFSCSDDSNSNRCSDQQELKRIRVDEFVSDVNDAIIKNVSESENINLAIYNQSDYDHYIETNPNKSRPTIDFNKKILLAGRIIDPNCGVFKGLEVNGNCTKYACLIVIEKLDCDGPGIVRYFALIDKTDAQIDFETAYHQP
jgi:hypothetical protein